MLRFYILWESNKQPWITDERNVMSDVKTQTWVLNSCASQQQYVVIADLSKHIDKEEKAAMKVSGAWQVHQDNTEDVSE